MPVQADSTNFSSLLKKSTKELNSEKFYETMNLESSDLSKYNQKCQKIDGLILDVHMIKICEKYLRYLEDCELLNNQSFGYDVSILFNYWLYDKLTNIYGSNNDSKISLGFANLQYLWTYENYSKINESDYKKCKPDLKMVNHQDWEKRKQLYDYCVNYDYIEQVCTYFSDNCEEHCKYINGRTELYKHFESLCNPKGSDCPEFYDKCKNYNPSIVLNTLKCHEKMKTERDPDLENAALGDSPGKVLESGPGAAGPLLSGIDGGSHDTYSTSETSQIGTKVGHSILGIAPVLVTASALYRYTPVGSWVRKLGGYNQNSISNMDGEMDGFLSNSQEPDNMFLGNSENYISYQPM
ncbi:PIR Superfamily Protein [Plasmodium ovale curtisi]|uniref:PIR Superfamily Protein n=1 Tax=Plasmodium ovale curtisi TaxID=864141 RepID=A0A1A8XCN5_PLAOA|nr:PIR Superfamily Protein [Plasmodium ovale curtisi]